MKNLIITIGEGEVYAIDSDTQRIFARLNLADGQTRDAQGVIVQRGDLHQPSGYPETDRKPTHPFNLKLAQPLSADLLLSIQTAIRRLLLTI